jgi:nucleoside-diphosphate kinase
MDRTFVMIKPDGVQRGLVGDVISRLERKGLKLVAMKTIRVSPQLASAQYGEHVGKPFYEGLIGYITSGPVIAMVVAGEDVVNVVRTVVGITDPKKAAPGTIRGDFGMQVGRNIIHASDSNTSAAREIGLFFDETEILTYTRIDEMWLYE